MSNVCKTCQHPKRLEIERKILDGQSVLSIAREYGLSKDSLYSHRDYHLSRRLASSVEKRGVENDIDLLSKVDYLLTQSQRIFKRNVEKGKDGIALKALAEARNTIELLGKISYSLHQAKIAELEAQNKDNPDNKIKDAQETQEHLDTLTKTEMVLYIELLYKMATKKKSFVVVPKNLEKHFPDKGSSKMLEEIERINEGENSDIQDIEPIEEEERPMTRQNSRKNLY